MKIIFLILSTFVFLSVFSQSFSENDLKQIAKEINAESKGIDFGNGVTLKNCFVFKRTFIYQYNVDENWYPPENMKETLITNFKEAGYAEDYFNNDINAEFYYYFGNKLLKKVNIKSTEFSYLDFELGDFISIGGHLKAKGVNLKLKYPIGWDVEEGDRPNIVKKFVFKNNSFMIIIKDNLTFFSKNEVRELFEDKEIVNNFILEASSFLENPEILYQDVVSVDRYPALVFTMNGDMERSGIKMNINYKSWIVFHEDKLVYLQCGGLDNNEFDSLDKLYNSITNSVIFPEQYNY